MLSPIIFALSASNPSPVRPIHYESFKVEKAYYHAVVADVSQRQVTAETMYSQELTSVWKLIAQRQPAAAITGTFFSWGNHQPVADVIVDGELVAQGHRGSALGVDWYGNIKIFDTPFDEPIDLFAYKHLLRGTVRLIKDGVVSPNPKAQGFTDSAIWGKAPRTSVGITKGNSVVLLATKNKVTLSQLGAAMKRLGVEQAVSLDGGGSTMLYYRGELVIPPERQMSNLFILHERPLP